MDEAQHRDVPTHGKMDLTTVDTIIERINEYLNGSGNVSISFQGGEPLLSGIEYFRYFIQKMNNYSDINVQYSLQTNATLIYEEFASFFAANHFLIGISLDGYERNMNYFRVSPSIENVYQKVFEGIQLLNKNRVEYNILTVVTRQLAEHPIELFDFYISSNIEYVQLIPCMPAFGVEDDGMSLTPEKFASFFTSFFKEWKKAYLKGKYINVNTFENICAMLQGYYPYQCGLLGQCQSQFVIEANGDVYPCDFYCLDEYRMGSIIDSSLNELKSSDGFRLFMKGSNCEKLICESCRYRNICHGGCQRQNITYLKDDYCGYQKALDLLVPELYELLNKRK